MEESELHNLIINDIKVQKYILNLLNIADCNYVFIHEDSYPNGMIADFTLKQNDKVHAIIECKGSRIGVNDYVRGIGQILQYQYFAENHLSKKGYEFVDSTKAVFCFPSSIIKNPNFNIGLFRYPKDTVIMEVNENNHNVRVITENELAKLREAFNSNLMTISQYYVRDNRIFELFILLRYLHLQKLKGVDFVDRKHTEMSFLRKLETPNNQNWRNAFISLSSLGFIDSKNLPTNIGMNYANLTFGEFAYELMDVYLKPYIELFFNVFNAVGENEFTMSNKQISNKIRNLYNGKDVLFVTDSDERYVSSWMNILRDDYGCISFDARHNERRVNYNPLELRKEVLIKRLNNNIISKKYIEKFFDLIK